MAGRGDAQALLFFVDARTELPDEAFIGFATVAASFCESFGFGPLEGVRAGKAHGEPLPMFPPIGALAAAM